MNREHCIRCYTPREWLFVLLLICLSGYIIHNEHRAGVLVHDSLLSGENAELQTQLIQINQERVEFLHEIMFSAHRLPMDEPVFPGVKRLSFREMNSVAAEKERE